MRRGWLAAALLLAGVAWGHGQLIREKLTDDNFEGTTQAATGQTTGIWFVKFCTDKGCAALDETWQAVRQELRSQQVFLAKVDLHTSPMLAHRFAITHVPTFYLFRNRKMYKFTEHFSADELRHFALESYEQAEALEVPPPPSAFDWLLPQLKAKRETLEKALRERDWRLLFAAVVPALLVVAVVAGFVVAATRKEKAD